MRLRGALALTLALVAPLLHASPLDTLLDGMAERLALAVPVAQAKWNSGAPVTDPVREQQLLDQAAALAPAHRLTPETAQGFFRAQFAASRAIQEDLHRRWCAEEHPAFAPPPDLAGRVRPALDALTPRLLTALGEAQSELADPAVRAGLDARLASRLTAPVPAEARRLALEPLHDPRMTERPQP